MQVQSKSSKCIQNTSCYFFYISERLPGGGHVELSSKAYETSQSGHNINSSSNAITSKVENNSNCSTKSSTVSVNAGYQKLASSIANCQVASSVSHPLGSGLQELGGSYQVHESHPGIFYSGPFIMTMLNCLVKDFFQG